MTATSWKFECLYVIEVNLYIYEVPPTQTKWRPRQYSTPQWNIKKTPRYIVCLFADDRFANLFFAPSDFYTISSTTYIGNTALTAKLRRDFNYDYILIDALAKSSHAYTRYGLQADSLNMNGQPQAVGSNQIIGYLTTQMIAGSNNDQWRSIYILSCNCQNVFRLSPLVQRQISQKN